MRVYLAGPPYADEYRARATDRLGDDAVNPMRNDFRGREHGNAEKIVSLDLEDIDSCDAVLADFTRPDEGTAMECWYAHSQGKPVFAYTGGSIAHPWVAFVARGIFPRLDTAIDAIVAEVFIALRL